MKFIKSLLFFLLPFLSYAQQVDTSQVTMLKKKAQFFADDLQYDSARVYYQKIADIYLKNDFKVLYYDARLNKIDQYFIPEDYKKMRDSASQLLKEIKQDLPENRPLQARCYYYLGSSASKLHYPKKALDYFNKGLKLIEKPGSVSKVWLMLLVEKGMALEDLSSFEQSMELLQKGIQLIEQNIRKTTRFYNEIKLLFYKRIVVTYNSSRNFDKGVENSIKALQILDELPLHRANIRVRQSILFNQALSYKNQRMFKEAIEAYKECITLQDEFNSQNFVQASNHILQLGRTYLKQRTLDSAAFYIQKSNAYLLRKYPPTHVSLADGYYNLGYAYTLRKKYALANENYHKALKSLRSKYGEIHPNLVLLHMYMGTNYREMEVYQAALEVLHKGLISNTRTFRDTNLYSLPLFDDYYNPSFFFSLLRSKAIVFARINQEKIKNLQASLQHFRASDNFTKEMRRKVFRKSDQLLVGLYINAIAYDAVFTCEQLFELTKDKKYLDEAFYFFERNKASMLLRSQTEANAKKTGGIPRDLLSQEKTLRTEIATYQRKFLLNKNVGIQDSLAKVNQAYESLMKRFEQDYPKYAQLKFDLKLAAPSDIQTSLDTQTALLEYIFCRNSVYLMVITKRNYQLIRIPEVKKVQAQLDAYYEAIQSESRLRKFAPASYQLYQTLVQPAKKYLTGIKKLVVIAPDVESTPFEALINQLPANLNQDDFTKINYLNKQYQISYHYSATLWQKEVAQRTKKHSNTTTDFLAFAPFSTGESKIYASTRGSGGNLPESGVEVKSIYNLFKSKQLNAEVSLAKTATKELFIQKMAKASIVHIASHSEANTQKPGLAKVRFSGCGGRTQDVSGCLLASEIYNLEMNADLLVLSSCSSGVGKLTKGEGVFSLARSFLYAGAHNVVFSLWDVDDEYTKKLMIAFYKHFLSNPNSKGYQKALQLARNQLAEQNIHPKHWAGIVLIGK
ncbi:hypothetical protein BKI52_06405 [marine bacterium AO1-C]|nr:hypothetical protein BKI52_06405 [marine bacterium AO1-C]